MPFFVATSRIGVQPASQRFDGLRFVCKPLRELAELIHFTPIDRLEQGFARREVTIERSYADASALRHGFEAGVGTAGAEDVGRRIEKTLAIADCVRASLAHGIRCTICHHA
jgi:hypothetical protein